MLMMNVKGPTSFKDLFQVEVQISTSKIRNIEGPKLYNSTRLVKCIYNNLAEAIIIM